MASRRPLSVISGSVGVCSDGAMPSRPPFRVTRKWVRVRSDRSTCSGVMLRRRLRSSSAKLVAPQECGYRVRWRQQKNRHRKKEEDLSLIHI